MHYLDILNEKIFSFWGDSPPNPRTHNIIIYNIKFKRIKQTNREYVSVPKIPQSYIDFQVPEKLVQENLNLEEPPKKRSFVYKK